jgi:transcriptional regulator with XRE-family HTH domain
MPTFTAEQVTAAEAYLGWSQQELGDASGLSFETILDYEHDGPSAGAKSIEAIRTAVHDAGVDFMRNDKRVGVTIVMPRGPSAGE